MEQKKREKKETKKNERKNGTKTEMGQTQDIAGVYFAINALH